MESDHPPVTAFQRLLARAQHVGVNVARPAASDVDANARFPFEAFAALREERLLSAAVPETFGGAGLSISEIATICTALGQHCSATAMVYAMHQIQVASIVRFGQSAPLLRALLSDISERQLLLASATSEVGVGGDMRSSICAIETEGERFQVEKNASVISYGEHADAILLTARRTPTSPANDQCVVYLRKGEYQLTQTTTWNTMGMRGTCSPGFKVVAEGHVGQILPTSFGDIAAQSMVPYSHIVWSALWLGIATDAVSRAHAYVRADARRRPGTLPFGAQRLAVATNKLQSLRSNVHDATRAYSEFWTLPDAAEALSGIGPAIRWNNLKVTASEMSVDIIRDAMAVCGMAGFSNDSKFSMGRQLRDATSAQLMIANDRIHTTTANLLLVYKDD